MSVTLIPGVIAQQYTSVPTPHQLLPMTEHKAGVPPLIVNARPTHVKASVPSLLKNTDKRPTPGLHVFFGGAPHGL